jgi:CIC family chloride channel protein
MIGRVGAPSWTAYFLVPVVAAVSGLVGLAFQAGSLNLRGAQTRRCWWIPAWMRPAAGALLVAWGIGITGFAQTGHLGVFSLGYDDLSAGLTGHLTWQIGAVLLGTKLPATILCYGSGSAGGIFSPTLFFGAITGLAIGSGLGRVGRNRSASCRRAIKKN